MYKPNPRGRRSTIHQKRFKDAWKTGIELNAASTEREIEEHKRRLAIDLQAPLPDPVQHVRKPLDPTPLFGDEPVTTAPRTLTPEIVIVDEPIEPVFEGRPRRKRATRND